MAQKQLKANTEYESIYEANERAINALHSLPVNSPQWLGAFYTLYDVTAAEAAHILKIPPKSIYAVTRKGVVHMVIRDWQIRVNLAEVQAWRNRPYKR